jgi:hypothetical protein
MHESLLLEPAFTGSAAALDWADHTLARCAKKGQTIYSGSARLARDMRLGNADWNARLLMPSQSELGGHENPQRSVLVSQWLRKLSHVFGFFRRPRVRSVHFSYEKAGLRVADEPIPWNAETVVVEAVVRLPHGLAWQKGDFQLEFPGRPPLMALAVHPAEQEREFRFVFRLPPLRRPLAGVLTFRHHQLASVALPFLSADTFLNSLSVEAPALVANLGKHTVACRAFMEDQCEGLSACGVLTSPTALLPILDYETIIEFASLRGGLTQRVQLCLTSAQLVSTHAVFSAMPPQWPLLSGPCAVRWIVKHRELAQASVQALTPVSFQRSLYLVESHYQYEDSYGVTITSHHLPVHPERHRIRISFLVASREPGVAALCPLEVRMQLRDGSRRTLLLENEMLVTDGPTTCVTAPIAGEDFQQTRSFELLSQGRLLGVLSACHTPAATFTSEGGFHLSPDCEGVRFSEEELVDRLKKLMEVDHV